MATPAQTASLPKRGTKMGHSKEYEHMRRKLGVHKKGLHPGSLLEASKSFKHHKLPKTFGGKSTKPGMGGRAKILESKGVPKGVIGAIARSKGEAPGQKGFHHGKHKKTGEPNFKKHKELDFKHRKGMACKKHGKIGCKEC
jgi:hypothetical protein